MSLPTGWQNTKLREIVTLYNGRAYLQHELLDNGTPIMRIQNLNGGDRWFYSDLELGPEKYCEAGDLLFAWSATFGPYIWQGDKVIYHYHIWKVVPVPGIIKEFVFHLLQTITAAVKSKAHGVAMPHMTKAGMEAWDVTLPPLNEQRRIVARIEELTARSKSAKEALQAIPPLLEKFRQSVLAAAFRGDLTAEWRRQNPDVESAEVLLERIRVERRKRWEESGARGKYVEPEPVDASGLPELPKGWCWASASQLGYIQLGRQRSPENHSGTNMVQYLRAANVTWKGLAVDDVKEMHFSPAEVERFRLRSGDILLGEASGSPGEVGKPAIWRDEFETCCFQNTLIRLRPVFEWSAEFLYLHFLKDARTGQFAKHSRGVGIYHLGAAKMGKWPIALAPTQEQELVALNLSEQMSATQHLEEFVSSGLMNQSNLDQSILSKAFRGELVPQDSIDEPASILLERIRAEKQTRDPQPRQLRNKRG